MVSTLTVDSNTYVDRAEADAYLADSIRAGAWAFLPATTKDQALLTATRIFERVKWKGTKTDEAQDLMWPRTGVTDKYGIARDEDVVPQEVKDAECELAFELSQNAALESSGGTGSNTKRLKAGSAEVEYFRATGGVNGSGSPRFSPIVMELIGQFMAGAEGSGISGSFSSGTDVESSFGTSPTFGLNQGFP